MSFSAKSKSLAIIPKCSGFLSFIGSAVIIQDILRDRKKLRRVYHRLILMLSIFDMMASIVNILSTWPVPAGTPGVFLASGTTQTCTAQGFFNETGNMCTPMYNASLCTYYLLIIHYGWSEKRLTKIEPFLHIFPLTIGWTMGIIGLPFELYNNSGWLCWIAPYPSQCRHTEDGVCERGHYASLFRWIHYGFIWSAIVFVTGGMILIYRSVRQREKATDRFTNYGVHLGQDRQPRRSSFLSPNIQQRRASMLIRGEGDVRGGGRISHSRKVARQAMCFVSALYLTWTFTTLTRLFQIIQGKTYYSLLVLMAIFFPLQGFFNASVYLRPRLVRCRSRHPELSWWQVFVAVLRAKGTDGEDTEFSASAAQRRSSIMQTMQRRLSGIIENARRVSLGRRSSAGASSAAGSLRDLDAAGATTPSRAIPPECPKKETDAKEQPCRDGYNGRKQTHNRGSVQWAAHIVAEEMNATGEFDDSAKFGDSSKFDDSANLDDSAKIDGDTKSNESNKS